MWQHSPPSTPPVNRCWVSLPLLFQNLVVPMDFWVTWYSITKFSFSSAKLGFFHVKISCLRERGDVTVNPQRNSSSCRLQIEGLPRNQWPDYFTPHRTGLNTITALSQWRGIRSAERGKHYPSRVESKEKLIWKNVSVYSAWLRLEGFVSLLVSLCLMEGSTG